MGEVFCLGESWEGGLTLRYLSRLTMGTNTFIWSQALGGWGGTEINKQGIGRPWGAHRSWEGQAHKQAAQWDQSQDGQWDRGLWNPEGDTQRSLQASKASQRT